MPTFDLPKKFRANAADAYVLTNIQNQESGGSSWIKHQVSTKDKSFLPLHGDTTSSLLKVCKKGFATQVHDIFGDESCIATYMLDGNANDLSGNYDGTWHGTEQYDTGMFGQAAKFDGNSYITIDEPFTSVPYSISCWVQTNQASDSGAGWNKPTLIGFATGGHSLDWGVEIKNGYVHIFRGLGDGNPDLSETTSAFVADNQFHLISVNFDTTKVEVFVDSSLVATYNHTQINSIDSVSKWYIGVMYSYGGGTLQSESYYQGLIDQLRIFNRALTEDEVAFLYHEGLVHIHKHDQLIIYNATDGAKVHEVTSMTDNDGDDTYDIDVSSLALTEPPTNAHQLTKSVDLTDKMNTEETTATTLVLQDSLESFTLVKSGETLVVDGNKLENIAVTRSLVAGGIQYSIDISALGLTSAPQEVVLVKPRVEISIGDVDKANADDLVLDVDTANTTESQIVTNFMDVNDSQRARIKNTGMVDTDVGLGIQVSSVTEEGDGGSPEKFKYTMVLAEAQSSAPTCAIIRPHIQDVLSIDMDGTSYDSDNDEVNVSYMPVQKETSFRCVQVKWNAHRKFDENISIKILLWPE